MIPVWMTLVISVAVECLGCRPCPEMCTCKSYGALDCSHLGLTAIAPGLCADGMVEDFLFSDNNIAVINWYNIPPLSGRYCDIDLRNNRINQSLGIFNSKECNSFDLDLSSNSLTTLPTNFFIANGNFKFVDILLMHNSITDIMPGAIKFYSSRNIYLDIDLSFNKVSYIHPGAFDVPVSSKFFNLILQNNNIVSFSILRAWRSVTDIPSSLDLDLRYNLIEDLDLEDENEEYDFLYERINVMLANNPWNCDCKHKRVAFDNSNLKRLFKSLSCYQPICGSPEIVQNISVLSLSLEDFICPPRLDSDTDVMNMEIKRGKTVRLVCPVTYAEPPISHYDWTFSPKLPAIERQLFGKELWDVRFIRRTTSYQIVVENVQLEDNFECRAVSPNGSLSVNISVSFPKIPTTVPSDGSYDDLVTPYPSVTSLPMPVFSVMMLSILCCAVSILLSVALLALCIVSVKYFKLLHSKPVSGRDTDTVPPNPKPKSRHQTFQVVYKVSKNVSVDDEEYCLPSKSLATGSKGGYVNFNKYRNRPTPRFCNWPYDNDR